MQTVYYTNKKYTLHVRQMVGTSGHVLCSFWIFGGLDFLFESFDLSLGLSDGVFLCFNLCPEVAHLLVKGFWSGTLMVAENSHCSVGSVIRQQLRGNWVGICWYVSTCKVSSIEHNRRLHIFLCTTLSYNIPYSHAIRYIFVLSTYYRSAVINTPR